MAGVDTITAIATARGRAALAVVRLSGPQAIEIASSCFAGADLRKAAGQTVHFGRFLTGDGEE
ncbi:MAG: tRNA uridine-5-carboxymethylaminomethyl(34) synthesis GTPase MnmE, partial [Rhodothermales bacterium]|nr:tRNA uridine-5-carboxymethylaminomethyl(34) synthesis GTPase MnmE [Rhodothermales bacterium]